MTTVASAGSLVAQRPGPPRTADGRADLQGIWSFATLTPLERPRELADKAVLTAEEAAAYERVQLERQNKDARSGQARQDVEGAYNNIFSTGGGGRYVLPCSFHCSQRGLHLVKCGVGVEVLETLHSRPKVIDVVA